MRDLEEVRAIVQSHYGEVAQGFVDKTPSNLARGEGIQKNFYIIKIDLAESTAILAGRRPETYLKMAHTFLSSIDKIARQFGADGEQIEYQGDSVIAYFPERIRAEDVLKAACLMRAVVHEIAKLDRTLGAMSMRCKIVIDFAKLIVAKIGPRASSTISAIGHPIHLIAKMEKMIGPDMGRVTIAFRARLDRRHWLCLPAARSPVIPVPSDGPAPASLAALGTQLSGRFGGEKSTLPLQDNYNQLSNMLKAALTVNSSVDVASIISSRGISPQPTVAAAPVPLGEIIGYNMNWDSLYRQLGLS